VAAALPPVSLIVAVRLVWMGWLPRDVFPLAVLLPAALGIVLALALVAAAAAVALVPLTAYSRVVSATNFGDSSTLPALQRPVPNPIKRRWEPDRPGAGTPYR
jgi:hypothetical protein